MERLAPSVVALALSIGCSSVLGVDDYSVAKPVVIYTPADVSAFLGGGACQACVLQHCAKQVDACVADASCAMPATCMGGCTDPACMLTTPACHGSLSPQGRLLDLAVCAEGSCTAACEIGNKWDCSCNYEWPPPPATGFPLSLRFYVWNSNPIEYLSGATVDLCNDIGGTLGAPLARTC
jgi:hypothetical protein